MHDRWYNPVHFQSVQWTASPGCHIPDKHLHSGRVLDLLPAAADAGLLLRMSHPGLQGSGSVTGLPVERFKSSPGRTCVISVLYLRTAYSVGAMFINKPVWVNNPLQPRSYVDFILFSSYVENSIEWSRVCIWFCLVSWQNQIAFSKRSFSVIL